MMRFKIGRVTVCVTYGFFLMLTVYLLSDLSGTAAVYLTAVLLHEAGHLLCMKLLHIRVRELRCSLCGLNLQTEPLMQLSYRQEMLLAVSGPLCNLAAFAVCRLCFGSGMRREVFCAINLFLAVYNLLPVKSLDGGRMLRALLLLRCSERTVLRWLNGLTWLCTALLLCLLLAVSKRVGFSFPLVIACAYLSYFALLK